MLQSAAMMRIGEDNVLSNWIKRIFPGTATKRELHRASGRVSVSIRRYKDASKEIQDEIANNGFAEFLIYDRGVNHGGIDILLLIAYGISFICALLLIAALFYTSGRDFVPGWSACLCLRHSSSWELIRLKWP